MDAEHKEAGAAPRAKFNPPDTFIRKGSIPMRRLRAGPWQAEVAPAELVTRLGAANMEFRVGNIVPNGSFTLFLVVMTLVLYLPLSGLASVGIDTVMGNAMLAMGVLLLLALEGFVYVSAARFAYAVDWKAGDSLTVFDRKRRKVHQRMHPSVSQGEFDWDRLVPYIEERHRGAAINYALTYVEFDPSSGKPIGFVTVEMQGNDEQPLLNTCSYIAGFMENGITQQPRTQLSSRPLPGWYTYCRAGCWDFHRKWRSLCGRSCSSCSSGRRSYGHD